MRGRHSSGVPVGIRTLLAVAGAGLLIAVGIVAILTLGGPAAQPLGRSAAAATEPGSSSSGPLTATVSAAASARSARSLSGTEGRVLCREMPCGKSRSLVGCTIALHSGASEIK